jgi:hypothetical protein
MLAIRSVCFSPISGNSKLTITKPAETTPIPLTSIDLGLPVYSRDTRMFYEVNLVNREFNAGIFYDGVDWTSLQSIVENYRDRVRWWYLDPADHLETGDRRFAFPVMALSCILLDSLSQFYFLTTRSSRKNFIKYASISIPEFAANLPHPIQHKIDAGPEPPQSLTTFAEVLYFAFRCGILHDAHVTPYGMVRSGPQLIEFVPNGLTTYAGGADCPTVMIDPWRLRDRVRAVFDAYVTRLLDPAPANNLLRLQFKSKFTESFGVDVSNAQ